MPGRQESLNAAFDPHSAVQLGFMSGRLRSTLWIGLWLMGLWIVSCSRSTPIPPVTDIPATETGRRDSTAGGTLPSTASPAPTSTPGPTATPTPTPTATALAMPSTASPMQFAASDPVRQNGAPCGFVDYFDFPLMPPDGEAARGGGDYGRFRSRYEQYHAGEDWGLQGRNNFGEPVFSVGHGLVTYAQPLGWGADKGVVILEHTFPAGRKVYSMYGHLDPPSVELRAGQCLPRGAQVGAIGRPRTPPHLHFEIRLHLPTTPGPGYWGSDPSQAGWLPPSLFIWNTRLAAAPGVVWAQWYEQSFSGHLGAAGDSLYLLRQAGELVGLDLTSGLPAWRFPLPATRTAAQLSGDRIWIGQPTGELSAYLLPQEGNLDAGWQLTLQAELDTGQEFLPALLPLPAGGILAAAAGQYQAYRTDGEKLWDAQGAAPVEWVLDSHLYFTATDGSLWRAGLNGAEAIASASGPLFALEGALFVYSRDGIYRLDPAQGVTEPFAQLPASTRPGSIAPLSGGGILVLHTDIYDTRLLAYEANGALRWERSVDHLGSFSADLVATGGRIYLVSQELRSASKRFSIYQVDPIGISLLKVFEGGSRRASLQSNWTLAVDAGRLFVNIDGGSLVLLDPQAAAALQQSGN